MLLLNNNKLICTKPWFKIEINEVFSEKNMSFLVIKIMYEGHFYINRNDHDGPLLSYN